MSLKHALLGILSLEPMTGYEVKQFFDSSVQHFWNAELSQIYPTLKALEESGFVDMRVEVQQNRPNRKIYAITDQGRSEFERWFRVPQPPADLRDPFLIKVFFATDVPVEDTMILLRRQMEEQQKMLLFSETVLRDKITMGVKLWHSARHGMYWSMTLDLACAYRRAYIAWCEQTMRKLEASMADAPNANGADAASPAGENAPAATDQV